MIFSIVQKRGQQMTKKQVKLLAYMLAGIYVRIAFPIDIAPDIVNGIMLLAGLIIFWGSFFLLLETTETEW